jgi:S1-C subfamily serine protease
MRSLLRTALAAGLGGVVGALAAVYLLAAPIRSATASTPPTAVAAAPAPATPTPAAPDPVPTPRPTSANDPATTDPPATGPTVPQLYQGANPGVVSIHSSAMPTTTSFFASPRPEQGVGSGFVVDTAGDIVTNFHVIDGASDLLVSFSDGTTAPARLVGQDPGDDLAVIQVSRPADQLHPLTLGDSAAVQVGEPVVAIGNPFDLPNSVTSGIVSALGRSRPAPNGRAMPGLLQTDAPVNPGDSGGPLLDANGRVIGVLAQIESPVLGSVGVGFAIPSDSVATVLPKLLVGQTIPHAWLGVTGDTITPALAQSLHLSVTSGVYVTEVFPGGPGVAAGLKAPPGASAATGATDLTPGGDVITSIDGQPLRSVDDLSAYLNTVSPTDTVSLTVIRDDQPLTVRVALAPWPDHLPGS